MRLLLLLCYLETLVRREGGFKPRHQQVRTARSPVGARVEPTRAGRHQTGTAAQSFTGHALRACTPRGSGPVVTEDGSCSARELTEPTQRPDAGHEVVVPATVAHERGKPSQTSAVGPLRDGERVMLGVRGDEGVDLLGSAHGAAVVDPLLLDELELAC